MIRLKMSHQSFFGFIQKINNIFWIIKKVAHNIGSLINLLTQIEFLKLLSVYCLVVRRKISCRWCDINKLSLILWNRSLLFDVRKTIAQISNWNWDTYLPSSKYAYNIFVNLSGITFWSLLYSNFIILIKKILFYRK